MAVPADTRVRRLRGRPSLCLRDLCRLQQNRDASGVYGRPGFVAFWHLAHVDAQVLGRPQVDARADEAGQGREEQPVEEEEAGREEGEEKRGEEGLSIGSAAKR